MDKILSIFDIIKKCSNAFHLNIVALNNNKKRVLYQIAFSIIQRSHEIQHQHTKEQYYLYVLDTKLYTLKLTEVIELIRMPSIINKPELICYHLQILKLRKTYLL